MQITIAYRIDDYQLSDGAPKKNQTKNRMYNIRVITNEYFTFQSVKSSILMEFYNHIGSCYVHILYIFIFQLFGSIHISRIICSLLSECEAYTEYPIKFNNYFKVNFLLKIIVSNFLS